MRDRYLYLICLSICLIVIGLPILFNPLSTEQKTSNVAANEQRAFNATFAGIYGNNMIISVSALLPLGGAFFMFLVLCSTGLVVASYPSIGLMFYLNPILWIEISVYAYMVLLSFKSYFRLAKKDWRGAFHMIRNGVFVAGVVLLISAFIEMLLIKGGV